MTELTKRTRLMNFINQHPGGVSKSEALKAAGLRKYGVGRTYLNEMEEQGLILVQRNSHIDVKVRPAAKRRK